MDHIDLKPTELNPLLFFSLNLDDHLHENHISLPCFRSRMTIGMNRRVESSQSPTETWPRQRSMKFSEEQSEEMVAKLMHSSKHGAFLSLSFPPGVDAARFHLYMFSLIFIV